ncbi:tRNA 5-methoxyuridine(34)/uridine 5-oxyacetic acid(34) synthase CmoB [Thiothrix subterranea]|uniref:tRNA 5-methoxyuridine(34)/uridine 5-oxyacetic acid(34) synthase CmoB n=1 Tax=Thiothrix subterranea TaxID=2735563 RepID=UPI00192B2E0B|nr:tRNA 5-methoxyuridine(34)/uridine 5-oxyacetic acid(34) synthase CmoB [Thiothrix subterranea]QQZ30235.1 tRNA 5-methoxyuridine(34)/uridine 5-oxyacetic acid(34) synthase CmoB [Thiothrix subterranea]
MQSLYRFLQDSRLAPWLNSLPAQLETALQGSHGKWEEWQAALVAAPDLHTQQLDLNSSAITLGTAADIDLASRAQLSTCLQALIPWRKGPYHLFGIEVDTEWRSDWKWERVLPHLSPLSGRLVLDVGCGSGYHLWRMRGAGAEAVIGIDPTLLFLTQFQLIKRYAGEQPVWMLPLKSEDLPDLRQKGFDTVFSMGVLYHRRDPLGHLQELRRALRAGGELVLETLVVAGDEHTVLMPHDRYAKMRNVWFIPSVALLELWLKRLGFTHIRVVDVTTTSTQEQRCTAWSKGESLADFLDSQDISRTIEGYPAPVRATLIANTPA